MAVVITQYGGFVEAADKIRVSLYTYLNGQLGMMDFSFDCTGQTGSGALAGEVAGAFQTLVATSLAPMVTTQALLLGTKVSFYPPSNTKGSGIATDTRTGSAGSQPLPTQVRGLIAWTTQNAGRAFRGRSFVPFPDVTLLHATSSHPTAAYGVLMLAFAAAVFSFTGAIGAGGNSTLVLGIFHRKAGKSGVPVARTITPILNWFGSARWGTQRRSGDRGRINSPIIT